MKKSTYSRPSQSVSTVKKSHANIGCACARRNSPAESSPHVSGRQPSLPQDRTNRRRRDVHAHTGQLADDPLIPPAWVLTGNPQHELADVLRRRGSAGTAPRVGPPSPNKPAMPTQQRVRADEERLPARSPQKPAGRSQEDTVAVLQTRAGDLPAKNRQLVSKHNDLELLELTRTQTQAQPPLAHSETTDTPATRARADSLHQDANEARPYGREVTSATYLDVRDGFTHPTGRQRRSSRAAE